MDLWQIIANKLNLEFDDDFLELGIILQDDLDGKGAYIAEWNYSEPIPEGLKLGK